MAVTVAIIGGGASGLLAAMQLLRRADAPVKVLLIEPGPAGNGIAYSTRDSAHRLNVPAAGMTAHPDDAEHFVRWLRANRDPEFPSSGFAMRADYAAYLDDVLAEAIKAKSYATEFEHVRTKVTALAAENGHWRVDLADRPSLEAHAVVLALGAGPPLTRWAPAELVASPRFVADPWAAPVAEEMVPGPDGTVLLVGAGLTMADMAMSWGRRGATVHVTSRHGMLPLAHVGKPGEKPPAPAVPQRLSIANLRHLVFAQIRTAGGDWRAGVDSLRAVSADLWRAVAVPDRVRFLRGPVRHWGRVRHRVAPEVGAWLDEAIANGRLVKHEGTVASAHDEAAKTIVELTDGSTINADVVVNCTGPANEPAHSGEPLLRAVIDSGVARAHPVGIGLDVTPTGHLRSDEQLPPILAIGPMRQGELWESTAIPEIRAQALEVACEVVTILKGTVH